MLTTRRSTEKKAAKNINSMAMVWLQQAVAMPFIIATLFFAKFYLPGELSVNFWRLLAIYVVLSSLDLFLYFKALSMADVSYVAPMLSLVAVTNIIGAYFVLGQKPSVLGMGGAVLIVTGAYLTNLAKRRQKLHVRGDHVAVILVLIAISIRSYYGNIEVLMLREANPTSYNFYSSILTIPFVILVSSVIVRQRRAHYENYWGKLKQNSRQHMWALVLIGLTYTVNMLATYQAKLLSPNAGYVAAIKAASVLPIVLIGAFLFKEKVVKLQWVGLALIIIGILAIATN